MKARTVVSVVAVASLALLGGCATTAGDVASTGATARHDHMRDAKQGYASSGAARVETVKPLHDHRDYK